MPANALAWALGMMIVIFAGLESATSGGFGPETVLILAVTLACAGAVVGAVYGLALVWLLRSSRAKTSMPPQDRVRRVQARKHPLALFFAPVSAKSYRGLWSLAAARITHRQIVLG